MRFSSDSERPWKCSVQAPPSLILELSNGKQIALAWFIVTQLQMDSLKDKSNRDPISIMITVGRASYGIAIFKEQAEELWNDLVKRRVEFIRPAYPIIEIGKIKTAQPD